MPVLTAKGTRHTCVAHIDTRQVSTPTHTHKNQSFKKMKQNFITGITLWLGETTSAKNTTQVLKV